MCVCVCDFYFLAFVKVSILQNRGNVETRFWSNCTFTWENTAKVLLPHN